MTKHNEGVQTLVDSPLGPLRLVATPAGLMGLWFERNQRHAPTDAEMSGWRLTRSHPLLDRVAQQLDEYFAGERSHFECPLDLRRGTPFQRAVWHALLEIPAGQTTSYGELARRLGRPPAARAVGAAVGRNPLAIVVPCHRVLGRHGSLTGYAGGLDRKQALLELELGRTAHLPCLSH